MRRLLLLIGIMVPIILAGIATMERDTAFALLPGHDCASCHNLHGAPGFALLSDIQIEVVCLTCHGPTGESTLKADVHTNDSNSMYPTFVFTCRDCHNPHNDLPNWLGGTNIQGVGADADGSGIAEIETPNSGIRYVVFESRGTTADPPGPSLHSFADADEDGNGVYDGICEVCHTLTRYHRNDGSAGTHHNTGRQCTRCHEHITNFIP